VTDTITAIALNKLLPSPGNVRKIEADKGIDKLALLSLRQRVACCNRLSSARTDGWDCKLPEPFVFVFY
jgi:hypothetical protein